MKQATPSTGAATADPLVSIVLPTFNGSQTLRQSVESCLGQTHRNIELIIVDDASTDNTPEVIRSFSDPRLAAVRNERNLKLPASLNAGFKLARGGYLTWTSDDNYYAPAAIEKMLDFLLKRKAHFVACDYYRFKGDNSSATRLIHREEIPTFRENNGVGPCFLYTRAVFETTGSYDEEAFLAEDYDYWIRVSKNFQIYALSEPLYYYREHERSLTAQLFCRKYEGLVTISLIRVKNRVSTAEGEYLVFVRHLSRYAFYRRGFVFRGLGRLLRTISFGRLQIPELFAAKLKHLIPRVKDIFVSFEAGQISFNEAKAKVMEVLSQKLGAN